MARILVENVTYQLEKLGENDYSFWITHTPDDRDSGISLRGTKREIQNDVLIDLDTLFYAADTEKSDSTSDHLKSAQSIIKRLASFFFEINYDCIEEYSRDEAKRTGIEFDPPKNKVDADYYEKFIASVIEYDANRYGKDYVANLFNEHLKV